MKKQNILLLILLSLFFTTASAAIRVNTLRVNFIAGGDRFHDIFVKNIGTTMEYVDIQPFKRANPAKDPQEKTFPKGDPKKFGLVVTPRKVAIAPGHVKRVRILNLNKSVKEEMVYGVHVKPVKPPLERLESTEDTSAGGVRIIAAYNVGVYVMPTHPKANVSLKRNGKELIISNTGNINVLLDKGKQCKTDDQCESIEPVRVYANSKVKVELLEDLPVSFEEIIYNSRNEAQSN